MRIDEAESRLREMLAAAGVDIAAAQPAAARTGWETYKAFAAESVAEAADDPDRDMLNYVYGTADLGEGRRGFSLLLRRQLEFHSSDGEYDRMDHLLCSLSCDLTPELEQVPYREGGFWSRSHLAEWITEIEQSPGFTALMDAPTSTVGVQQDGV